MTTWVTGFRMLVPIANLRDADTIVELSMDARLVLTPQRLRYISVAPMKMSTKGLDVIFNATADGADHIWPAADPLALVLVACGAAGDPSAQAATRLRVSTIVGLLGMVGGRNLVFERVFDNLIQNDGSAITAWSASLPNPLWFKTPDLTGRALQHLTDLDKAFERLQTEDAGRIRLALRWFDAGLSEADHVDAFIKFWIALETAGMPDDADVRPLNQLLATAYDLTYEETREKFKAGRLQDFRSRIVHRGQQMSIHGRLLAYLEALFRDVVEAKLGMPSQRSAESALSGTPDLMEMLRGEASKPPNQPTADKMMWLRVEVSKKSSRTP